MTAQDVINSALRKIGALATGESPTTDESNDSLEVLNDMIDSWNAQRLAIYAVARSVFPLVSGTQVYTLGTGGTFNMARPAKIERMSVVTQANSTQPLELPIHYMTVGEWQQTPVKNVASTFPFEVWDDQAFPKRNLTFWPTPQDPNVQAAIYAWSPLSSFADLVTDYTFPPAYARAIRANLAVELAPEFQVQQLNPLVVQLAVSSLATIKSLNSDLAMEPLRCDLGAVQREGLQYNWITGGIGLRD